MKKTVLFLLFIFSISSFAFAQEKILEPLKISQIRGINVFGKPVDNQTRCVHWHSDLDIIAIKFKCCDKYYPCFSCHEEEADHEHQVWPKTEFDQKAILCGVCGTELGIQEYMDSNNTCPKCKSSFNPGCSKHYHLYFETEPKQ
ncbi:CHY zinc finger protein [Algoriphagus limi]|uniref:CHY zinc finger protein n=1 Tax=Algoriphagus limi TaxID=2975273 RepID=A0ABT2G5I7_9BACT|nr:CHY zinc finger protein [Algoriphagus limi]MCS5489202.1 CHY zinc finger protein [Algoriphagus limi]